MLQKIAFSLKQFTYFCCFLGHVIWRFALKPTNHNGIIKDKNVQAIIVSGRVEDGETGEFVQGVTVIVKGNTTGTISNNSWAYKISVSDNNAVLVFSEVNYLTQEVQVNGKISIGIFYT